MFSIAVRAGEGKGKVIPRFLFWRGGPWAVAVGLIASAYQGALAIPVLVDVGRIPHISDFSDLWLLKQYEI